MSNGETIWKGPKEHLPKRTWLSIGVIRAVVEDHVILDEEDLMRTNVRVVKPGWKSNVHRLV